MNVALFVFNGDPMCFIHVLLNALDMDAKGCNPHIVMEGASVKLVPELVKPDHPLHNLFTQAMQKDLVAGACRACSVKLGVDKAVQEAGVELIGDMNGHPSMLSYIEQDYKVITF